MLTLVRKTSGTQWVLDKLFCFSYDRHICKQNFNAMNCTTCDQVSNCQHQAGAVPGFLLRSFLCSQNAIIQKMILPNLATYWI
jgi:hypothetical protein